MNREEVFAEQSKLMNEAVVLLTRRIEMIEVKAKHNEGKKPNEEQAVANINIFKIRSLKTFRDALEFIANEILLIDQPKRHLYLLSSARTLLDTYARLLHLIVNCHNENHQALTCLAYQLLVHKSFNKETLYIDGLRINKDLLAKSSIKFPANIVDFKWGWMVKNKLIFANRDELLSSENIKKYSSNAIKVFGANETYKIYSSLSELMHGNPYYYNDKAQNERFWVAGVVLPSTAFLIELIDRTTLNWNDPRDFRDWLKKVEQEKEPFLKLWRDNPITD